MLALRAPRLVQVVPPPVYEVTIAPRYVASRAERPPQAKPAPRRPLIPRRLIRPDEPLPVAPLVTPNPPRGQDARPDTPSAAAAPEGLRNALRRSAVGCANPERLTRAEREACLERLGAGAKDAPFIEPPMSRDKRMAFDRAAASKEAYRKYKEGNLPVGTTQRDGGPQMKELPPIWPPN